MQSYVKLVILHPLMTLFLDFGNTRVKAAVSDGQGVREVYCGSRQVQALESALKGLQVQGGMWCSVREVDADMLLWMQRHGLRQLTPDTPVPLANAYSTPATLGMDRMAAAVGAWSMAQGQNILVVDSGTAVTYDFVDASGVYRGGNIAPGIRLRLKSLHEHTGVLPLVEARGVTPMLGTDTETALRSGAVTGVRNEISGYITELESKCGMLSVFLTGGDAEFFDIKGKSSTFVVPNLVLIGLERIYEFNEKSI